MALRENETLAASVGIDAHALPGAGRGGQRGAWPASAGGLYAHYTRFVSPEVFLFTYTVTMVIMVVAGGKGTLAGPVVGAVLFTVLPEALRELTSWQWQMLLYGVLLIAVLFFMPQGIVPALRAVAPRMAAPLGAAGEGRPAISRCATSRCASAAWPRWPG